MSPISPLVLARLSTEDERRRVPADHRERLAELLAPFLDAHVLEHLDIHAVDLLGRLVHEVYPEVLLGLAFAVRAPRHGHICVVLDELQSAKVLPEGPDMDRETEARAASLPWPVDRAGWCSMLASSPLVRGRGKEEELTPFVLDQGRLYMDRYWRYQLRMAEQLAARAGLTLRPHDPGLLATGLHHLFEPLPGEGEPGAHGQQLDRQKLGAAMALLRSFTVISGGPGTGKTYTVRNVLTLLFAQREARRAEDLDILPLRVALAAPTGKAAARMRESINQGLEDFLGKVGSALGAAATPEGLREFLASLEARTLHRLLGWRPSTPSRFRHDADHPLPYDVVIVDETSMVDFALMAKLVDAVPPGARLILIGDRNQLASVEAGTVLADLCGEARMETLSLSGSFVAELRDHAGLDLPDHVSSDWEPGLRDCIIQLDRNRRFDATSGIGRFAKSCLADRFDARAAAAFFEPGSERTDLCMLPHGERSTLGEELQDIIREGYLGYLLTMQGGQGPGESEEELHLRVLEAFDRFRILCAHRRGRLGVSGMNKAAAELLAGAGLEWFRPSGKNYIGRPVLIRRNDYTLGRFNGDVGIIVPRAHGRAMVAFPNERGGVDYLAPSRLPEHQTAFAMTIHKSQGSEFAAAVVLLPEQHTRILTRELIYTGVTRARKRMVLVGSQEVLARALQEKVQRASGLAGELWGAACCTSKAHTS